MSSNSPNSKIFSSQLNELVRYIVRAFVTESQKLEENNKNQTVREGEIELYKGVPKAEAMNLAKMFWYIHTFELDKKGVWNFFIRSKTTGLLVPCCKVGLYRQMPAILNRNGDGTEQLLVGSEMLKNLDSDMLDPKTDKIPMKEMERPWNNDAFNVINYAPHGDVSGDSQVIKMATKIWGEQNFDVYRDKITDDGHLYLMRGKTSIRYALWKGNDGQWKYLETPSMGVKKWVTVPADKLAEMTGTAAVAAVQTPMAFSKRKVKEAASGNTDPSREEMIEYLQHIYSGLLDRASFDDAVEAAIYWFANFNHGGQSSNLYSALSTSPYRPGRMETAPQPDTVEKDMFDALTREFGSETDLTENTAPVARKQRTIDGKPATGPYTAYVKTGRYAGQVRSVSRTEDGIYYTFNMDHGTDEPIGGENSVDIQVRQNKTVAEMTTTGDVTGYNVPSAFARKGGSKKGVEGSAALGYTLTNIGQAEMSRQGDRLLENAEPHARQMCNKCKQLKPTDSQKYVAAWQCHDCRNPMSLNEEKTKPDYGTQLQMAYRAAKSAKDAEAITYYQMIMNRPTSASVPFEKFKGSWAYEQWIKRQDVQQKIADNQAELKNGWRE